MSTPGPSAGPTPSGAKPRFAAWSTAETWHRDRYERRHREFPPTGWREDADASVPRVRGPWERRWAEALQQDRESGTTVATAELERRLTGQANPLITPADSMEQSVWTWVVEEPAATAVLLWTNPYFDFHRPTECEFARLPGSDLWLISYVLPSALRMSYRIGIWRADTPPPWRESGTRHEVLVRAAAATMRDPRGAEEVYGSFHEVSSVASGPAAPPSAWDPALPTDRDDSRLSR